MSIVRYGIERLGALTDGVFAIVLTLLVLELKIPELPNGQSQQVMLADLVEKVPDFVAWLISFVLVARFWTVHHMVLANMKQCHVGTIVLNFIVLALCSLIPFGSSLIGTYEFDRVAVSTFSALLGLSSLSLGLFARRVAIQPDLLKKKLVSDLDWQWKYHVFGIPLVALGSVALEFVSPLTSLFIWFVEPFLAVVLFGRRQRLEARIAHGARDE